MAPASLYAEFGGKAALFTAALDLYVDESRAWYRSTLDDGPPGLPALRRHFASYDFGDASRRGCLLVNSLGQRSEIPAPARRRVDAFFRWVEGRYAHHLEVACDAGALRSGADPAALAAGLVAFDQGLAVAAAAPSRASALRGAVAAWLDSLEASPGQAPVPAGR